MNKPYLSLRDCIKIVSIELISIFLPLLSVSPAHAAGSNMPWEQPLQQVLQSVEGPVAKIIAVIIIVTTGLTLAFGETSSGFRRLIQIIFGLSIAFAASSFCWSDRRRQERAARFDGLAVSPLCWRADFCLRFRRMDPGRGACHGRRLS